MSAKVRTGPATVVSTLKKTMGRAACHQRPRTRSELPRKDSRSDLSVNSTSCCTNAQPTSFESAQGMPTIVMAISATPRVASSCAVTTRQTRVRTPLTAARKPAGRDSTSSRT
jgi:hypothetical protein